jgi:molybdopterin-binding protein
MRAVKRVSWVYGAPVGVGGLGVQVASAIQGVAIEGVELHAGQDAAALATAIEDFILGV